jgi:hypothetical protein
MLLLGSFTYTVAVVGWATSVELILAINKFGETKVVAFVTPSQTTWLSGIKF